MSGGASDAANEASDEGGEEDPEEGEEPPVQVVRAEFWSCRPVIVSEVPVYVGLRQRDGRFFEDTGACLHVRYSWSRGPLVKPCIFHPEHPSRFRDVTKTFQFYCSRECFLRGWHSLPKERWNPQPENIDRLEEDGNDWIQVADTRTYCPTKQDIDHPLRLDIIPLMEDGSDAKVGRMYICTGTVMATPDQARTRRMISNGGTHLSAEWLVKQFKVMDWNILADLYTTETQYPYCERYALAWSWRKHLIIKELNSMAADVITLQEVQKDAFDDWFKPQLGEMGYEGVFQQKKREPIFHKGRYTVEGCATFYKSTRFKKLEKYVFDYDKLSITQLTSGSQDASQCLQRASRGNIALALVLEDQTLRPVQSWQPVGPSGGHKLCIVNTHICADPRSTDVKTWQAHLLAISIVSHGLSSMPLLVCGDFNSTPDSAVYEYMRRGSLRMGHPDLEQDPCGLLEHLKCGHSLRLNTAYEACSGREAAYTNYTEDFKGSLDYIFFSSDSLAALAVSQVDEEDALAKDVALPSITRPSDHVSLVATFMFRDDVTGHSAYTGGYGAAALSTSSHGADAQGFVQSHLYAPYPANHWYS